MFIEQRCNVVFSIDLAVLADIQIEKSSAASYKYVEVARVVFYLNLDISLNIFFRILVNKKDQGSYPLAYRVNAGRLSQRNNITKSFGLSYDLLIRCMGGE